MDLREIVLQRIQELEESIFLRRTEFKEKTLLLNQKILEILA